MTYDGIYRLQERLQHTIVSILSDKINSNEEENRDWRMLIFDDYCSQTLENQFTANEIRKCKISMLMNIKRKRQQIDEIDAIYMVQPIKENIDIIINDIATDKYNSYTLCFTYSLTTTEMTRLSMEIMGKGDVIKTCKLHKIHKIINGFFNFQHLDVNLVTLGMNQSYQLFNDKTINEQIGSKMIDEVVNGLFSVIYTMSEMPIIVCKKDTSESFMTQKLVSKLHSFITQHPNEFVMKSSKRPLLLISNRNIDLLWGLIHGWNYQSIIYETMETKDLKIIIDENTSDSIKPNSDFWKECKLKNVGEVSEIIQRRNKELFEMNQQIKEDSFINFNEQKILLSKELERELSFHIRLGEVAIKRGTERFVPKLYQLENSFIIDKIFDKKEMNEIISNLTNVEDIKRLYYICVLLKCPCLEVFDSVLESQSIELKELEFIKEKMEIEQLYRLTEKPVGLLKSLKKGLSNMMNSFRHYPIVRLIQELVNNTSSDISETNIAKDGYIYFDPMQSEEQVFKINENCKKFDDIVVFMLGGGSFMEYSRICEFAQSQNKHIIYVTTEMMNGNQFLKQISSLV